MPTPPQSPQPLGSGLNLNDQQVEQREVAEGDSPWEMSGDSEAPTRDQGRPDPEASIVREVHIHHHHHHEKTKCRFYDESKHWHINHSHVHTYVHQHHHHYYLMNGYNGFNGIGNPSSLVLNPRRQQSYGPYHRDGTDHRSSFGSFVAVNGVTDAAGTQPPDLSATSAPAPIRLRRLQAMRSEDIEDHVREGDWRDEP